MQHEQVKWFFVCNTRTQCP